jgi:hypothetical protein
MNHLVIVAVSAVFLTACESKSTVRVSNGRPVAVETKSRSEPIFYNGKTYQLDFNFVEGSGTFDMRVSGMGPKQKNDAVAVATSSLGYYACPEGQKGRLQGEPAYAGTRWRMQAKCG